MDKIFDGLPYDTLNDVSSVRILGGAGLVALILFLLASFTLFSAGEAQIETLAKKRFAAEFTFNKYFQVVANKDKVVKNLSLRMRLEHTKKTTAQTGCVKQPPRRNLSAWEKAGNRYHRISSVGGRSARFLQGSLSTFYIPWWIVGNNGHVLGVTKHAADCRYQEHDF